MKTFKEFSTEIEEAKVKKLTMRGGVKQKKITTDKPGYKMAGGKEVKMDPKEIRAREKGAKKAVRKRAAKSSQISKARAKTMKKRKSVGLDK